MTRAAVLLVTALSLGVVSAQEPAGPKPTLRFFRVPSLLPEFTMKDLDGRSITSASLRGKVVLVNFWATWCGPCRAEIPDLIALQAKYPDTLQIIGISQDEAPPEKVRQFAQQFHLNYPVVMTTAPLEKIFPGVTSLPTTFVVDRDGRLEQKHIGMLNALHTELETRVLAGLTDATIERIEDSAEARLAHAAQANSIPGVDLKAVAPEERGAVLQELNDTLCTCGCKQTVAGCRIEDPACDTSLPQAKKIVEKHIKKF
jgi:cytochrome c biogenesis protein CcmG/thiol:disulfide interchange protein DsbE